ncbi:hypothetical protein ABH935_001208 [Catenulispora sp. GAS73]
MNAARPKYVPQAWTSVRTDNLTTNPIKVRRVAPWS